MSAAMNCHDTYGERLEKCYSGAVYLVDGGCRDSSFILKLPAIP
jgi:hypothetical protein